MKKGRLNEDQIIGILKQHEAGQKVADLGSRARNQQATIFTWKSNRSESAVICLAKFGQIWSLSNTCNLQLAGRNNRRSSLAVLDRALARFHPRLMNDGSALEKILESLMRRKNRIGDLLMACRKADGKSLCFRRG